MTPGMYKEEVAAKAIDMNPIEVPRAPGCAVRHSGRFRVRVLEGVMAVRRRGAAVAFVWGITADENTGTVTIPGWGVLDGSQSHAG